MEYNILSKIKRPSDLKELSSFEIIKLTNEIRHKIIDTVSKNGGHLASNLGVVELTIALHLAFDFSKDQLVFDVSHQSYAHKLITGRFEKFDTIRTYKGLSGYSKIKESSYDAFGAGHASTSISVGLGLKTANELLGKDNYVVSLIGDGALTGGMAFEGLNALGHSGKNMITIINDNEHSISENVGALSSVLNNLRTSQKYVQLKDSFKDVLPQIPIIGTNLKNFASKTKSMIKQGIVQGMFFEELGLTYIGVIDAHNIPQMLQVFNAAKDFDSPIIIHVISQKGKGYLPAIEDPEIYHGVGKFSPSIGIEKKSSSSISFSEVFGNKIIDLAKKDNKVVAITAAMGAGTKLNKFKESFPNRFFDVGIAEEHAMAFAAGLAKNGIKPYFAVYSTFLQRAYDQLIHDVCIQNLPVRICIDRCGLVGEDGPTHHGVFDMSMLLSIPNLEILSPTCKEDLELCLEYSLNVENPICIRYPRYVVPSLSELTELENRIDAQNLNTDEVIIISFGIFYPLALKVANDLKSDGINAKVIKLVRIKPLNLDLISNFIKGTKLVVTIEDSQRINGFGAYLQTLLQDYNHDLYKLNYMNFAYPDTFVEHGSIDELNLELGIEKENIVKKIKKRLNK